MCSSPLAAPQVLDVAGLPDDARRAMHALYERYYGGSSWEIFSADLAAKDHVLLLHDQHGALQGFSTLAVDELEVGGAPARVLFSGDTVVDELHWGQQALAFAWLRFAGSLKARRPDVPLYWLLISKGHRTFRYLSAFSRDFHPSPQGPSSPGLQAAADALARDRFGDAYDAATGVVRFPQSRGHLRAGYADVSEAHRRLPEVGFFLSRNPGYAHGDELVCLCELAADKLQPIARRAFLSGARSSRGAGLPGSAPWPGQRENLCAEECP